MNELLLTLERLHSRYTPWTVALTAIAERIPADIVLSSVTLNEGATLRVEGHAMKREALLAFRDALQVMPFLRDVAVPFSNLLQRERIDFSIDARIDRTAIAGSTRETTP
jgi:Tfp pilus assembly protein PilN